MGIVLFDTEKRSWLYPFTLTRAVADLKVGMLSFKERWNIISKKKAFVYTEKYLRKSYKSIPKEPHLWINAAVFATEQLWEQIENLPLHQGIKDENGLIACYTQVDNTEISESNIVATLSKVKTISTVDRLQFSHEMIGLNATYAVSDFKLVTQKKSSQPIDSTNQIPQQANIFIEEGASVNFSFLNATTGPIYIAKNAVVQEGTFLRGPLYIGENSLVKMGAKIYGAYIGENCVVGGEIKNIIMFGNSNKAHDGYLGDSVIGEWCNFGAGTSNSNVKNTGSIVQIWNEGLHKMVNASQKCGVLMGDYTRTAINSSINTGSYIGVCCNVFGQGLLDKKINNFAWGNHEMYELEKAIHDIKNWKAMKKQTLSNVEESIIRYLFPFKNV
jgi:UDP-N-acetylglucosamine diphosphorylase / glucose-1-phosphate thymidylyltransferase / UDP-N-acetylgalactosamine diphosphorylase / glucosamine-1-phosphate N-acetyltransferase / galactosamine-1-phosphate N-acetyltransferase